MGKKLNLSKKKKILVMLLLALSLLFISSKAYENYMFYKNAFNWTAYSTICNVRMYSDYILVTVNEIEVTKKMRVDEISKLEKIFYEVSDEIQKLQNYTNNTKKQYQVDLSIFKELTPNIRSLYGKHYMETGEFNLEVEEVQNLKELKETFQVIYNAINEKMKDTDNEDSLRRNDVLKDDLWLKILKNIDMKLRDYKLNT